MKKTIVILGTRFRDHWFGFATTDKEIYEDIMKWMNRERALYEYNFAHPKTGLSRSNDEEGIHSAIRGVLDRRSLKDIEDDLKLVMENRDYDVRDLPMLGKTGYQRERQSKYLDWLNEELKKSQ